jgi:hypothetical protein
MAVEPTIEVEASATFGVQLDEMTTGISNAAESTLSFVFVEEQTEEFGEGEVYGWIELEDFKVEFDSSDDDATDEGALDVSVGSVTGKVFLGPAYISLDEATVEANEASAFALVDAQIISYTRVAAGAADIGTTYAPEFPGVALGFKLPDVVTVEFGVASLFDWEADAAPASAGANHTNAYIMSIDAEITAVENITIAVVSTMEFGDKSGGAEDPTPGTIGNPAGVGVSVEYAMPMGDMTLSPVVGFDLYAEEDNAEDTEYRMEFGLGAKLDWKGLGLDEDEDDHIDFVGTSGDDGDEEEVTSGAYLGLVYGIHSADLVYQALNAAGVPGIPALALTGEVDETISTIGVRVGLYEDSGDDGLLPVLGAAVMVEYTSTLENEDAGVTETTSDLGIGIQFDADLGVATPYAGFLFILQDVEGNTLPDPDDPTDTASDSFATMNVGVDLNVISNTTFTIDWASGDLLYDKAENADADPTYGDTWGPITSSTAQLGVLTVETKVEF